MDDTPILLPVFNPRTVKGFPDERAPRVSLIPIEDALVREWQEDAHFAAYTPSQPFRMTKAALTSGRAVAYLSYLVFDIDAAAAHAEKTAATPEWRAEVVKKLDGVSELVPGAFSYETRGGLRLVARLKAPFHVASLTDAAAWRDFYHRSGALLSLRTGLECDASCADWTRPFRLPFVRRDGTDERRRTFGHAGSIGTWLVTADDLATEQVDHELRSLGRETSSPWRAAARRLLSAQPAGPAVSRPAPAEHPAPDVARARAHARAMPPAIAGQHGHNALFCVALALVRGHRLDDETAFTVLKTDYNPSCQPPWSDSELRRKVDEARTEGQAPFGYLSHGRPPRRSEPAPRFTFVTGRELGKVGPPLPWVCKRLGIAPGRPTLLAGFGGSGKSIVASSLLLSIAAGRSPVWDGVQLERHALRVVHFDYELGLDLVRRRYQRLAEGMGVSLDDIDSKLAITSFPAIRLSDPGAEDALREATREVGLALVDCLQPAAAAKETENDAEFRRYLDVLSRVSNRTGCAFLVVHHEGKPSKSRASIARVRGSSAIIDACATVLSMARRVDHLTIEVTKSSLGPRPDPVTVRIAGGEDPAPLRVVGGSDADNAGGAVDLLVLQHVAAGLVSSTNILKAGGARKERLQQAIASLLATGQLMRPGAVGPLSVTPAGHVRLSQAGEVTPSRGSGAGV